MGSPINPIVANLYRENFEVRALSTSPNPPLMQKRFVDDTFVVMKKAHKEEFLTHLNSVDKNIQFTTEEPRPDGSIPFLDILITPGKDGRLDTKVYRKPTHTNQYMHWDSHHTISSKYSVVGTLHHRAKTICSNKQLLQQEEEDLSKVLMKCKYPIWALNRVKIKMSKPAQKKNKKKSGVIYSYKCGRVKCDEEYIGESSRTFEERFKEHQKAPSPIFDHYNITGHSISIENFNIVGREDQNFMRAIKEALYIRVSNQSLNRNIGKYHLPHIWDEVLLNISDLKIK